MIPRSQKPLQPIGPYELLEKLGFGGMGSVYKAKHRDREAEGFVAVKVANRRVASEPVLAQRFQNEFAAARDLHHPNLVRALDCGVDKGLPYLVLEYVPGSSLSQHLKDGGPLPLAKALTVFTDIAEALKFIHANHFVHRDIKPANILVNLEGRAKLADLGLVKDLDASIMLTQSRMGLGTLEYAAPEQFDDAKNVDRRCDFYALAATMYVTLTGINAFGPGSMMNLLQRKLNHQFTPVRQLQSAVSPALEQIIHRSLHPDPEKRPADADELLAGLKGTEVQGEASTPRRPPPPPPDNRRGHARYPVQLATTCEMLLQGKRAAWPAQVLDLSAGGVCVQAERRFEVGTALQLTLPGDEPGMETTFAVRVNWCKALPDSKWLFGCASTRPMDQADLERLLLNELSSTNILRG